MIDENYKLRPSDVLEFISPIGSKGLGNLLTADDIMSQWSIDSQQYEELLVAGLPVIRFGNGDARHPEIAVDEFFREMTNRLNRVMPQSKSLCQEQGPEDVGQTQASVIAPPSRSMTTKETSILLGCSYSQARSLMLDGRIKSMKDGRLLRTRREWIEEYMLSRLVKAPASQPKEIKQRRSKTKLAGQFRKGGLAYEFLRSRPD